MDSCCNVHLYHQPNVLLDYKFQCLLGQGTNNLYFLHFHKMLHGIQDDLKLRFLKFKYLSARENIFWFAIICLIIWHTVESMNVG